jgi:hypothetical protein
MPADVLFSIQKNSGLPFRTNSFRETWIGKDVYRECWGEAVVSVNARFDLHCARRELLSPLGAFNITIDPEGEGTSALWNFQVKWKKVEKPIAFNFVCEKYPKSPEREYICIPSDPRKGIRLESSRWEGTMSFVYLL